MTVSTRFANNPRANPTAAPTTCPAPVAISFAVSSFFAVHLSFACSTSLLGIGFSSAAFVFANAAIAAISDEDIVVGAPFDAFGGSDDICGPPQTVASGSSTDSVDVAFVVEVEVVALDADAPFASGSQR